MPKPAKKYILSDQVVRSRELTTKVADMSVVGEMLKWWLLAAKELVEHVVPAQKRLSYVSAMSAIVPLVNGL